MGFTDAALACSDVRACVRWGTITKWIFVQLHGVGARSTFHCTGRCIPQWNVERAPTPFLLCLRFAIQVSR